MGDITACDTVYTPGNFNQVGVNGNPYPYGECTAYCWQYMKDLHGVSIPGNLGNATDWVASAHRLQWAVDMTPAPDKIACWSSNKYPPFGHVAVVTGANGNEFDVKEWNFTYFNGSGGAGKTDCRHVSNVSGITGFITPAGVTPGTGGSNGPNNSANPLDALTAPLQSIGNAIQQAELYARAELMTAEAKAMAVAQIGGGLLIQGSGVGLLALTYMGKGDPAAGFSKVSGKIRSAASESQSEAPMRQYTDTEQAWLSRKARTRAVSQSQTPNSKRSAGIPRGGIKPGRPSQPSAAKALGKVVRGRSMDLTPTEAAWVKAHPTELRNALKNAK